MAATILKRSSTRLIFAVALLVGLAFFLWRLAVIPAGQFPVTLLQMSNDPKQGRLASFNVTNGSGATIDYWIYLPQVKSSGVWSQLQHMPGAGTLQLTPGQAFTFSVAVPMNAVEWRLPVRWCYRSHMGFRVIEMWTVNLELNWKLLLHGITPKFYGGEELEFYMSYSRAITDRS
jgi:hypothetical protein